MTALPVATPIPHWCLALVLALILHLALGIVLMWQPSSTAPSNAVAAGSGGVEISLGPAGSAPGSKADTLAEPLPEKVEDAQQKPVPEPQQTPVKPTPVIKSERRDKQLPKAPPEQTTPVHEPVEAPIEDPVLDPLQQSTAPAIAGTGQSGSTAFDNTGSGDNTVGGGIPGDTRDYAATLQVWLEKHKRYPRRARSRRQQGTALLFFVVDRQGQVLNYRLEQSSGFRLLDEEALAMIQRAQPLPAMPASMQESTLELVVPVEFYLR